VSLESRGGEIDSASCRAALQRHLVEEHRRTLKTIYENACPAPSDFNLVLFRLPVQLGLLISFPLMFAISLLCYVTPVYLGIAFFSLEKTNAGRAWGNFRLPHFTLSSQSPRHGQTWP
jgi:hypothetical protein